MILGGAMGWLDRCLGARRRSVSSMHAECSLVYTASHNTADSARWR
jgi:hypothetical protein